MTIDTRVNSQKERDAAVQGYINTGNIEPFGDLYDQAEREQFIRLIREVLKIWGENLRNIFK